MIDVSTACLVILVLRTQFGSDVGVGTEKRWGEAASLANGDEKSKCEEQTKSEKDKKKNVFELILGVA